MKYRYIGEVADYLDDGRLLEPGGFVEVDEQPDAEFGPQHKALVLDGKLLKVEAATKSAPDNTTNAADTSSGKEGKSS